MPHEPGRPRARADGLREGERVHRRVAPRRRHLDVSGGRRRRLRHQGRRASSSRRRSSPTSACTGSGCTRRPTCSSSRAGRSARTSPSRGVPWERIVGLGHPDPRAVQRAARPGGVPRRARSRQPLHRHAHVGRGHDERPEGDHRRARRTRDPGRGGHRQQQAAAAPAAVGAEAQPARARARLRAGDEPGDARRPTCSWARRAG